MAQHSSIFKVIFGFIVFIFIFSAILDTAHSKSLHNTNNHRSNHHPNNNNNNNNNDSRDKVLLTDVQTLTLKSGQLTNSRRTKPIQQLECIGGTAKREYELYPKTIQCYNMGTDYDTNDVQWRCDANLDTSVKLGKIDVSCEGYSYPDDPYITTGSCGVYYELEYTDYQRRIKAGSDELGWFGTIVWLAIIGFIIYAIAFHCNSQQSNHNSNSSGGNGGSDDNFPYGGNDQARDNYNGGYNGYPNLNNNYYGSTRGSGASCGANNQNRNGGVGGIGGMGAPGWGGAALAGLAGFFMGRNTGRGRNYYSTPSSYRPSYSSSSSYRSSSGGPSGVSSNSSSHSGTSRR